MKLKTYSDEKCPLCGRGHAVERVRRSRVVRFLRPKSHLMKCRLCLTRYLVRRNSDKSQAV